MKNGRINERNTGNWSNDSEPKTRNKTKRFTRSFTAEELELASYLLDRVSKTLTLEDYYGVQVFKDNGDFLCQFDRLRINDFWNLQKKLH